MLNSNSPLTQYPVIAVDGPSASGKGTLARRLAKHYDYAYLDTGLLYRAIGTMAYKSRIDLKNQYALNEFAKNLDLSTILDTLGDPELRNDDAARNASLVAPNTVVRAAILKYQKDFYSLPPFGKMGTVLDGRDIGTVIAPYAPVKLFITATLEARTDRRFKELQSKNEHVNYAAVLADMKERDLRDATRDLAPAKPASDAIIIDTSTMSADEVFADALKVTNAQLSKFSSNR